MRSIAVLVTLIMLALCSEAALAADDAESKLTIPAISFPTYQPGCGDGHHIVASQMLEGNEALVFGSVDQGSNGYAVAAMVFFQLPTEKTIRVLGFVAIDHGPPITVSMTVGEIEYIVFPKLKPGKHEATTGTFYLYRDGTIKQMSAFDNCFMSAEPK